MMMPFGKGVYSIADDPAIFKSLTSFYPCPVPKTIRDSIGGYDFVIGCTDGKVKCHKSILFLHSKLVSEAVTSGKTLDNLAISCTVEEMENVLDLVYGISGHFDEAKMDKRVKNIHFSLYSIIRSLKIDVLSHYTLYRSHFHDLDVIEEASETVGNGRCNLYTVSKVVNWIVAHDKAEPKELIEPIMTEMCRIAVGFSRETKMIAALKTMMMKLSVPTLKIIFEQFNIFTKWVDVDDDWRIDFLIDYMEDHNIDEIRSILLPRTSMVEHFTDAVETAAIFGVPSTAVALMEYQLNAGYFYDSHHEYKMLPQDDEEPMTKIILKVTTPMGSTDNSTFKIELDVSYLPLIESCGVLKKESKSSLPGGPPPGCVIQ